MSFVGTVELAGQVVAFLDAALVEVVPERDIPAARAICEQIIEEWPPDDTGWESSRRALAEAVAGRLDGRPSEWGAVLHLVALYLDGIQLDEPHPRQEDTEQLGVKGRDKYRIRFHLALALAEALLKVAGRGSRRALFEGLEEWNAWTTTAEAFAVVKPRLEAEEIIGLLNRVRAVAGADAGLDRILDPILNGLVASEAVIDEIIDDWPRLDSVGDTLDLPVLTTLAHWRLPRRADGVTVRQRLTRQLAQMATPEARHIALVLAFRSWPAGSSFEERSALLVATLDIIGPAGAPSALQAIAYDPAIPSDSAFEVLPLIDRIVRVAESSREAINARLWVLHWLSRSLRQAGEVRDRAQALAARMPAAAQVAVDASQLLDWVLGAVAPYARTFVEAYVLDWLEANAAGLPSTRIPSWIGCTDIGEIEGRKSMVDRGVASRRSRLRSVALRCLFRDYVGHGFSSRADVQECRVMAIDVSSDQVLGLAHAVLRESDDGRSNGRSAVCARPGEGPIFCRSVQSARSPCDADLPGALSAGGRS
ncbi:MAG: hypothetical protein R3F65_20520 [bacterium]